MGISYNEKTRIFKLDTPNSTYMIKIADEEGFVLHMYYGKRLEGDETDDLCRICEGPYVPSKNERERCSFNDCAPFEYPGHGLGDYRGDAFSVLNANGHSATTLSYRTHRIYSGKPALKGLPATFAGDGECTTLELVCSDWYNGLEITLIYSAFEDVDAIARSVRVKNVGGAAYKSCSVNAGAGEAGQGSSNAFQNCGQAEKADGTEDTADVVRLTKVLSTCVEFDGADYDTVFLHGSWGRERMIDRKPLGYGKHYVSSLRGESSHQESPFLGLLRPDATEDFGEVYGFNFVYSGNFIAQAEKSQFDTVRVTMGINPVDFCWKLAYGEEFQTPEVISVYSAEGIGQMTRTFHDLYRKHLIRSPYKDRERPILINNWEATYFDFNTEKLLSIAREAKKLGIEMLVMDDGWFGKRNDDSNSLGDWFVNEDKLQGGLKYLVDAVNKIGLKFGIWFEPEMISPDSELYRVHPDWAIQLPGKKGTQSRAQFVLDLSRQEVVDYTYNQVASILRSANIAYVKWDMNRQLTDLGSSCLGKENQGELFHRYCLGVYSLQERLITEFPELLLENCSGGGARFDPGILYYAPQIWCSDDTDAIERLAIQQGTALVYPLSTMGAHVSDCPNHAVGRSTPFETRGYVALAGTFGYELDVTRIPEADRSMIPAQVAMYHKFNALVRNGDYYRVESALQNNHWDCWMSVAKDKTEAICTVVETYHHPNFKSHRIKLKGLDPKKTYSVRKFNIEKAEDSTDGELILKGDALMYAGINIRELHGDFKAVLYHICELGTDLF